MKAVRELLSSLIDYAGFFPPASLDLAAAARNYEAYRNGPDAWALGRFILPVARLDDLPAMSGELSVIGGPDVASDLHAIAEFGRDRTDARIASLELKASTPEEIGRAAMLIGGRIETFYEIPIAEPPDELLAAVKGVQGRAKVRTGGVKADAFPSTADLVRFLKTAAAAGVPFKATAGLHHPVRCVKPLTYEPGSATAPMHGFLNLFAAAAEAYAGGTDPTRTLEATDPKAIRLDAAAIARTRREFALSFGSCSFEEPLGELKELGFL